MISENFIYVGAVLTLIGSLDYVINTLKGKTKPNRVTWFLWALAPLIAFGVQLDEGVGLVALMTFMVGFGPLMVFIASFVNKKSYWKITKFDLICGLLSCLGLLLWLILQEGNVAIAMTILADGLAALPTVLKSYREPRTESYLAFLLSSINAIITLLAVKMWDFTHVGFPIYILTVCTLLFVLIRFELGPKLSKYRSI
ncbi:MAG: hypothetical protein AAB423_00395 [Patescibacteria group bacterium]